jgi:non-ribosomal peptide synthetase component E (peptide arylation enzyme)
VSGNLPRLQPKQELTAGNPLGETPFAVVILSREDAVTAWELRDWVNERVVAKYQRVYDVAIMKEFPRSARVRH